MVLIEVCADSLVSCVEAHYGGAQRIELCSSLKEGGLTPSMGLLKQSLSAVDLLINPMIRCRGGDFLYSSIEIEQMLVDLYYLKKEGAHGFVYGALSEHGILDYDSCKAIIKAAHPLPVTLHRAFDMSRDLFETLECAIDLGFKRILTSGGKQTAEKGIPIIRDLTHKAKSYISIMAGSGISLHNAHKIVEETSVKEIHGSFQKQIKSNMLFKNKEISMYIPKNEENSEYNQYISDQKTIKNIIQSMI